MTASSLRALTRKALAAHAKKHQIAGWHEMTKDELVAALAASFRRRRGRNGPVARVEEAGSPRTNERTGIDRREKYAHRSLGGGHLNGRRVLRSTVGATAPPAVRDSLTAEANDPCWIHVRWTLSRDTLSRAEAAMGMQWHCAIPILRILDVTTDDSGSTAQTRVRDVEIHGDVDHWYLPVENALRTYKVQIGYRAPGGQCFILAQSNRIQTPRPGSHSLRPRANGKSGHANSSAPSTLDLEKKPSYDLRSLPASKHWAGYGPVVSGSAGDGDGEVVQPIPVELRLHAELILHGTTDPHAELKLLGDRIPISRDGTFSHRFSLPEGRQVIDAVVTTRNGCHQRTIVLGIERNTKELEPQWFDEINP